MKKKDGLINFDDELKDIELLDSSWEEELLDGPTTLGGPDTQEIKLEAEKKLLIAIVSDAKLMDYKITRVLLKIHNHHPELKKDGQQIKRYLNEFLKELDKF